MKLLIDADGCPVVAAARRIAAEFSVPCLLFCDTSHEIPGAVLCDKGRDSADFELLRRVEKGDAVLTQDYGLAALCLARGARALSQDGLLYTQENIGGLLEMRALSARIRRGGGRLRGPSRRTEAQNRTFEAALRRLFQEES